MVPRRVNQKTRRRNPLWAATTGMLVLLLVGCRQIAAVTADVRDDAAPILDFRVIAPSARPQATLPVETAKTASIPTPKPTKAPRASTGLRTITGTASTYGSGYDGLLALPRSEGGRGVRVKICSVATGRCVTKTSNDVGPVARLHRVADLDAKTFDYLCACRWQIKGVQKVTVTFL